MRPIEYPLRPGHWRVRKEFKRQPLLEHTTDAHGYTDVVFALFDLLGLQFLPRLRDLANQRLCRNKGRQLGCPSLKLMAYFNPAYVRQHWDGLLRAAGALKTGSVNASLLISKLQAYPRQHHLTHLVQEYGRLVKTAFILRYPHSQALHRRLHAQLNKGEQLHALRSWLWFGTTAYCAKSRKRRSRKSCAALML